MSSINLNGKVAVVTGASQGLGEALAQRLDSEGCKVAVCDINFDGAQAVASKLKDAMALAVDVTKYDQLEAAAKAVIEKWGKVISLSATLQSLRVEISSTFHPKRSAWLPTSILTDTSTPLKRSHLTC